MPIDVQAAMFAAEHAISESRNNSKDFHVAIEVRIMFDVRISDELNGIICPLVLSFFRRSSAGLMRRGRECTRLRSYYERVHV